MGIEEEDYRCQGIIHSFILMAIRVIQKFYCVDDLFILKNKSKNLVSSEYLIIHIVESRR